MTTTEARDLLVKENPHCTYTITKTLIHRWNARSRATTGEASYIVSVMHDSDGAGMRLPKTFRGNNLNELVAEAVVFVHSNV
jgi:hypothetical protein